MSGVYLISDSHFSHVGLIGKLKGPDGYPMRRFDSVEEMDEHMVKAWNSVVTKRDVVYHLGDFCIPQRALEFAGRLNGMKKLVLGNHDVHGTAKYLKYFSKLYGAKELDGYLLTHIPAHPGSVFPRYKGCIHGHLHGRQVGIPGYYSVSAENLHYIPRPLEWVKKQMEAT
jgi:calcineurin-like phosphoesterase family protein